MAQPVNDPISRYERVVRSIYYPSQEDKKQNLKKTSTYPVIKEDRDEPEYINNKVSLLRVCKASATHEYAPVVGSALSWARGRRELRGFLEWSCRDIYEIFGDVNVHIVPDASDSNPYHIHLVIDSFKIEYTPELREKKENGELSYSDIIPSEIRAALDRLRNEGRSIRITNGQVDGNSRPCSNCEANKGE